MGIDAWVHFLEKLRVILVVFGMVFVIWFLVKEREAKVFFLEALKEERERIWCRWRRGRGSWSN